MLNVIEKQNIVSYFVREVNLCVMHHLHSQALLKYWLSLHNILSVRWLTAKSLHEQRTCSIFHWKNVNTFDNGFALRCVLAVEFMKQRASMHRNSIFRRRNWMMRFCFVFIIKFHAQLSNNASQDSIGMEL